MDILALLAPPVKSFPRIDWYGVGTNLVASTIWLVLSALFTVAVVGWRHDRRKFHGRWKAMITWKMQWATELMGSVSDQPHSEGEISLSFGAGQKKNQYWGLSIWTLKDGTVDKAKVFAELQNVEMRMVGIRRFLPMIVVHRLVHASLYSRFRHPLDSFVYKRSVAKYDLVFVKSTADQLEAEVRLQDDSDPAGRHVGTFFAERIA